MKKGSECEKEIKIPKKLMIRNKYKKQNKLYSQKISKKIVFGRYEAFVWLSQKHSQKTNRNETNKTFSWFVGWLFVCLFGWLVGWLVEFYCVLTIVGQLILNYIYTST